MYNTLQLAKILFKFYRKELKAAEGDATITSLPFALSRFLAYEPPDHITIMNTSKLKIGVGEAKTARPCCRGLIFAHFEQALGEQQMTEILTNL